MSGIFDEQLLQYGPWQEFERNTARLLLHSGWSNPQIVGRSGDGGADVLAIDKNNRLCLFQCKSSRVAPNESVIDEVRKAGKLYEADCLFVVTSRMPTKGFMSEMERLTKMGLPIVHYGPTKLLEASRIINEKQCSPPTKIKLREYQSEAVELLREAVMDTGRGLVVLATGLGKTVVMAELVVDLLRDGLLGEGRVLVLAHTNALINQLLMSFWRHLPSDIATHRFAEGERPISYDGITFATIQSFYNVVDPPYFDMVIVDEAHHLGSPTYTAILDKLAPPKIVGVTATPWRSDKISITHWLNEPVLSMGIKEGLAGNYLSEVDYRIITDDLDWGFISDSSQKGYTIAELNKRLFIPTRDEVAIRKIQSVFADEHRKRILIFSPSQAHAKHFASLLRMFNFQAASLTSDEDKVTKFKKIARFASGKINALCVVDIFNEGIDVPDVDMIVFMRVTHSRRIFVQQLGRGLRISPNKDRVIVLDFAADIRRIHAALDIGERSDETDIERLAFNHARIHFMDRSVGNFFYEWISDIGNMQDRTEEEMVILPMLNPVQVNYPDVTSGSVQ